MLPDDQDHRDGRQCLNGLVSGHADFVAPFACKKSFHVPKTILGYTWRSEAGREFYGIFSEKFTNKSFI